MHCARLHLERGHADPLQRCARGSCASMQRDMLCTVVCAVVCSSERSACDAMRCNAVRCGAVQVAEELFQAARALARICARNHPRPRRDLWGPYLHLASATSAPELCRICAGSYAARIFAEAESRNATARDSAGREHLAGTQVEFPHHKWDFRTTSGISAPQVGFGGVVLPAVAALGCCTGSRSSRRSRSAAPAVCGLAVVVRFPQPGIPPLALALPEVAPLAPSESTCRHWSSDCSQLRRCL